MQDQQKQLIDKLKGSQNVLVTVSKDPSVDQLAAAIGLALALNKLDKHATAVFSGQVPSTIEFLRPEDTLEATTDSLRDFIIALDKSKADKLRYKVEDQVVRIFITPYRTSITEQDLDFSQGDFNVDIVIALGVQDQQHIDDAIQAHGRILHDAVVAALSCEGNPDIGTLNVVDPQASSLSEMVASLVEALDHKLFDGQIATALLTGIVARTDRFSNDRTAPKTMSISSILMAAGANQQLIATELERSHDDSTTTQASNSPDQVDEMLPPVKEPGTLEIDHRTDYEAAEPAEPDSSYEPAEPAPPSEQPAPQVHVDENGQLVTYDANDNRPSQISGVHATDTSGADSEKSKQVSQELHVARERIIEPPSRDSLLSANVRDEALDEPTEELTEPSHDIPSVPFLSHDAQSQDGPDTAVSVANAQDAPLPELKLPPLPAEPTADVVQTQVPPLPEVQPPSVSSQPPMPFAQDATDDDGYIDATVDTEKETLTEIEEAVHSSHISATPESSGQNSVNQARDAVAAALNAASSTAPLPPITALNAQPLGPELHPEQSDLASQPSLAPMPGMQHQAEQSGWVNPSEQTLDMPLPSQPVASSFPSVMPQQNNGAALPPPPPVPPPPVPPPPVPPPPIFPS